MKELVEEYYTEPEKITVSSAQSEAKERKVDDNVDEYGREESATNDKDETESLDTSDEDTQNYHSSDIDNDIVVEGWYNMPCAYLCLLELQRFSWKLMFEAPLTPSPHSKTTKKKIDPQFTTSPPPIPLLGWKLIASGIWRDEGIICP